MCSGLERWLPFLQWWPRVARASLRADLIAGLTGSLIFVPQGVALATIAGIPPADGLHAPIFPALVAPFWGAALDLGLWGAPGSCLFGCLFFCALGVWWNGTDMDWFRAINSGHPSGDDARPCIDYGDYLDSLYSQGASVAPAGAF